MRQFPDLAFFLILVLSISGTAHSNPESRIYKWSDGDGNITYGQLPPMGVAAEAVERDPYSATTAKPRSAAPADAAPPPPDTRAEDRNTVRTDDPQAMQAACDSYRDNLALLENPDVANIRMGSDEANVLDAEKRESLANETRSFIEQWCAS